MILQVVIVEKIKCFAMWSQTLVGENFLRSKYQLNIYLFRVLAQVGEREIFVAGANSRSRSRNFQKIENVFCFQEAYSVTATYATWMIK